MSTASLYSGCTAALQSATFGVPLVEPRSDRDYLRLDDARTTAYWAGYYLGLSGRTTVVPTDMETTVADCFVEGVADGQRDADPDKLAEYNREIDAMAEEAEDYERVLLGHPCY